MIELAAGILVVIAFICCLPIIIPLVFIGMCAGVIAGLCYVLYLGGILPHALALAALIWAMWQLNESFGRKWRESE